MTGLGRVTPVGLDAPATWEALVAGRSGVGPITQLRRLRACRRGSPARCTGSTRRRCWAPSARAARRASRSWPIAAAREAVADAGLDVGRRAPTGSASSSTAPSAGRRRPSANVEALLDRGTARGQPLLRRLDDPEHGGLRGRDRPRRARARSSASALACASGTYALLEARRLILAGEADVVHRRRHRRGHHRGDVRRAVQHGPAVGAQRRARPRPAARSTPTATASSSARARS